MSSSTAVTIWERGRLDARVGPRQVLFGRMYEDPSIELEAFRPGSRVLCIASAGCTAMKLAPHHEVVAVDINPVQLAYAERRFDGDPGVRGRAERIMDFMRFFGPLAGWWPSKVRTFVELDDPAEQIRYWEQELNTWRFRAAVDGLFSVTALRSVYAPRFLDFLPKRLGSVMRGRMERCFARHPNRDNPYARSLLLGELSSEPPPPQAKDVQLVHADAASFLESQPAGELRRLHALKHLGRHRRGLPAEAIRGRQARRHPGGDHRPPQLRRGRRQLAGKSSRRGPRHALGQLCS